MNIQSILFSFLIATYTINAMERESWYIFADSLSNKSISFSASLNDTFDGTNINSLKRYHHLYYGDFLVKGQLSKDLSYYTQVEVFTEQTNAPVWLHDYEPYNGTPYNPQDTLDGEFSRTFDKIRGGLNYKGNYFDFWAQLDHVKMGPAKRNSLILNGGANPWRPWLVDQKNIYQNMPWLNLGYATELGPVKYTHHNGQLKFQKDKEKFFHYHRVALELKSFSIGINEAVVYGSTTDTPEVEDWAKDTDRTLQLTYALPFMPFFILEHYLGDRDNSLLGIDADYNFLDQRVYIEFMIDDLSSPFDIFKEDWWGNKYAVTLGYEGQYLINEDNIILLDIEWTRIEPWVYTHHKGGGYQYSNFNRSLGSDLGPNSMELYNQISYKNKDLKLNFYSDWVAKGTDKGSDINDIHIITDPLDKTFLNEATTKEYFELGFSPEYKINKYFDISLGASKIWGDYSGFRLFSQIKAGL